MRRIPLNILKCALLLFPLILGACAGRPVIATPKHGGIALAPMELACANPSVREACEASVRGALFRHGLAIDPTGPRVEVEAAFWQDADLGPDEMLGSDTQLAAGSTTAPRPHRMRVTADLTATILQGRLAQKVLTSGAVSAVEPADSLVPTGAPALRSACAVAAERLAVAVVEVLNED